MSAPAADLQPCLGAPNELDLWSLLAARAEADPGATFVVHVGERVTFGEAVERAVRTAAALAALGVRQGDKVAVMLPNCLEYLDLWFASAYLGAVLVPVNTAQRGEGLRYLVEHSEARIIVIDPPLEEALSEAIGDLPSAPRLLRRGLGGADLAAVVAGGHPHIAAARVHPDDLASILYTSGTTGLPKGVMNCHNAYVVAGHEFAAQTVRVRRDDVFYTSLPLFHINAQSLTTIGSVVSGRPMVLSPRFSASRFFDDMAAHEATVFNYIGAMLTMLYKQPPRASDSENTVRLAVGGAAPKELWRPFEERYGLMVHEIYGLTETACFCLSNPSDDVRVGQIGRPVSWSDVRIEDDDGEAAPPGIPGEICVRSREPSVLMLGYYKNPEATAEAMRGGWFHSGDRGVQDEDGYFTFLDRMKDSIRRRGENISSYEVERAVNEHPSVAESAAVGVPSDLGEEDVMVVVTLKPGATLDPGELVRFCEQRIAVFMVPRYVKVIDELPKTGTQRVRKFLLREAGASGAWDREGPAPPNTTEALVS